MIKVYGVDDKSDEYKAAIELATIATKSIPDIERNKEILLHIIPSAQMFGNATRDVDLLIIFLDKRQNKNHITDGGRFVHSFIAPIEVKTHKVSGTRWEGDTCIVKYLGSEHNATTQSEKQKNAVLNRISSETGNTRTGTGPFITNAIWLVNFAKEDLPKTPSNVFAGDSTWEEILNTLGRANSNLKYDLSVYNPRGPADIKKLDRVVSIFTRTYEVSEIDRKKLEKITSKEIDLSKKQYVEKLGKQMLIFRGRGGSGKTARLLNLAYQAYDEYGMRILILTYNKTLVADITRQMKLAKVGNNLGGRGIAVKTLHSFMYSWLSALNNNHHIPNFFKELETFLDDNLIDAVTDQDIKKASAIASVDLVWDLIMVDESQDWPVAERDFLFKLYGSEKIVIADGEDQLVRGLERTNWREGVEHSKSQVVSLRKSLRLKSNLCKAVIKFSDKIDYQWTLEPVLEAHGGRVVIVTGNPLSEKFHKRLWKTIDDSKNEPIDMLACVNPNMVKTIKNPDYTEYKGRKEKLKRSLIGLQYESWGKEVWDAVEDDEKINFPTSLNQFRIVQYDSCRGLEGWIVVNYNIDEFFNYKRDSVKITEQDKSDMFFNEKTFAEDYAKRWLMIALTRAIDTMILHISDPNSFVGKALFELAEEDPETFEVVQL
jgi:hypothetical protein